MALRTPTSILLLSVLVTGILSPSGLCAVMCSSHVPTADVQGPCDHASHPMSGMIHHHSAAMNHSERGMMKQRACPSNCDALESLGAARKALVQLKLRQTGVAAADSTNRTTSPDIAAAWGSSGGSPVRREPLMVAFSILRI